MVTNMKTTGLDGLLNPHWTCFLKKRLYFYITVILS